MGQQLQLHEQHNKYTLSDFKNKTCKINARYLVINTLLHN